MRQHSTDQEILNLTIALEASRNELKDLQNTAQIDSLKLEMIKAQLSDAQELAANATQARLQAEVELRQLQKSEAALQVDLEHNNRALELYSADKKRWQGKLYLIRRYHLVCMFTLSLIYSSIGLLLLRAYSVRRNSA